MQDIASLYRAWMGKVAKIKGLQPTRELVVQQLCTLA
jgi:hypothetical protein